jgi:hypothetical protein
MTTTARDAELTVRPPKKVETVDSSLTLLACTLIHEIPKGRRTPMVLSPDDNVQCKTKEVAIHPRPTSKGEAFALKDEISDPLLWVCRYFGNSRLFCFYSAIWEPFSWSTK